MLSELLIESADAGTANIGNALTNNFSKSAEKRTFVLQTLLATFSRSILTSRLSSSVEDVGITQGQLNIGNQLLCLGIVLWEIPSTMILYRVGPSIWLSVQIICWGIVAIFQAFQHGE